MENILSINLSTTTAPIVTEVRGKHWIDYGTEEWANLYPQFLIDLYYNSSTQAAIINATAELIAGEGLVIEDEEERDLEAIVKLKKFFNSVNSNESLDEVIKKIAFDFKLQGAFALNIVWTQDRTQIAEIYHIGVDKIRAEKPNKLGKVEAYYVSSDWSNTRMNKPYRVPAFNTNDRTSANQILYTGLYSPNMNAYYTPDYVAANNWALVDQRVAEFHLNNISNGFAGSFMISFANGVPSQDERFQIEQSLADKFSGEKNAGKFILTFSDDKTRTPEITAITPSDLDKQYLALQELLVQNILTGHRVTSPILMGIKSDTGLGNNADELNSAANYFINTVCKGYQSHIIKTLRKIFTVNNMDMPVMFEQLKPITTKFTNQDLAGVLTSDEIREEMGYAPLDVEVHEDFTKMSEYTELDAFIEEFGEDEPEGYTLLDEEIVDEETEDFDFENELNEIHKVELATVPKADRDGLDDQDGWSKKVSKFFKVRYKYDRDSSLTNRSGTRRAFCRKMMSAKKLYRKEDLVALDNKTVNPGFGPKGTNQYSIWLYKGGPQCFHRFIRKIYVMELEDAYNEKDITKYGKLISTAKARSQGFYPKPNKKKVAQAPRTMRNRGYLKPR
jgi:hypothetical protein